jgi:hypothetical protein
VNDLHGKVHGRDTLDTGSGWAVGRDVVPPHLMQLLHYYNYRVAVAQAVERLVWDDRDLLVLSRFHHIFEVAAA